MGRPTFKKNLSFNCLAFCATLYRSCPQQDWSPGEIWPPVCNNILSYCSLSTENVLHCLLAGAWRSILNYSRLSTRRVQSWFLNFLGGNTFSQQNSFFWVIRWAETVSVWSFGQHQKLTNYYSLNIRGCFYHVSRLGAMSESRWEHAAFKSGSNSELFIFLCFLELFVLFKGLILDFYVQ